MRVCFIPIDNRPVCYNLAKDIVSIDEEIDFLIPPREYLGDLTKSANTDEILKWMKNLPDFDVMVIALDTIAYGGLIPSRRSKDSFEQIKSRLDELKQIIVGKKVYAFSSIMRISNNNYNEEEKEYWSEYGKKIFRYSFSGEGKNEIPSDILDDYIATRKRNFEINKYYLDWDLETLIFSKDDCAVKGFNVNEAKELEQLGGKTKTGADEIPLMLLARAIEKDIKVFVEFIEPEYKDRVSNYEDVSIEKSVDGQLELGGFRRVYNKDDADLILVVNNFVAKQGELVMGWETDGKYRGNFILPQKPYAIADVRYANGADNDFVEDILPKLDNNFYGYAGWNTSANTIGSLLAGVKVKWQAKQYSDKAFKKLQVIRFLDDWAYQANLRVNGQTPQLENLMKPYEKRILKAFEYQHFGKAIYTYPWNRSFEIEVEFTNLKKH